MWVQKDKKYKHTYAHTFQKTISVSKVCTHYVPAFGQLRCAWFKNTLCVYIIQEKQTNNNKTLLKELQLQKEVNLTLNSSAVNKFAAPKNAVVKKDVKYKVVVKK